MGSFSTWLTLTFAGLAMGMIIFIVASGMTLVFGLMDVLNFGHGLFIAIGAYLAATVLGAMGDWTQSGSLWMNLAAVLPAMIVGMLVAGAVGLAFERVIVRPVYGQHLKQILITMGGMIIGEELIKMIWGPQTISLPLPGAARRGAAGRCRHREVSHRGAGRRPGGAGRHAVAAQPHQAGPADPRRRGRPRNGRKPGLPHPPSVRRRVRGRLDAGRTGRRAVGLYQQSVVPQLGAQVNVLIFIVIMIGGLGSTVGCLIGALLVGLMANYTGFLMPKAALFSNIALMVAILLWRPQGVYPSPTARTRLMSLRLLSGDPPRSMVLGALLIAVALLLLAAPFLFPGPKSLAVAAKILVFIVLVASYDLLLGYTGIVSFAHTMFFGIGAYGVAIASVRLEPGWTAVLAGAAGGLAVSLAFALLIGLASLRVRAIFYAMITLAVAAAFQTLVSQLSDLTGGEDGLNFKVPQMLRPAFRPLSEPLFGVTVDGRIITYYLIAAVAVVLFLLLLRIVNSPFGRVLQAIRENPFRAEAIGYRTVLYRSLSNLLAAAFATLAGALYALWLRYNGPDTSLSFEIMLNILLMLVIGGMGTMYGAVIGASLFVFAQSYLQDGLHLIHETVAGVAPLALLFEPDRWLLWLGILFVVSVYYFPTGIAGRLRELAKRR